MSPRNDGTCFGIFFSLLSMIHPLIWAGLCSIQAGKVTLHLATGTGIYLFTPGIATLPGVFGVSTKNVGE